jgi:hypothetical protein
MMPIMTDAADRPATGFDSELSIRAVTATTWSLLAPLVWTGTKGDRFVVPVGFVTDFATVPRILVWKTLPYGPYTRAAVLHDWLLTELAAWRADYRSGGPGGLGNPERALDLPPANSRDADGIFRRVMQDLGVGAVTRWQMWAAVRLASLFNPDRAYGRSLLSDAPAVFGVLLLSLPILLPGVVGVSVSLLLARPFAGRR